MNDEMIKVDIGTGSTMIPKSEAVKLSGKWYAKSSNDVVAIDTISNGTRYFRKTSRLIVKDVFDNYIAKEDAVTLESGSIVVRRDNESIAEIELSNGKKIWDFKKLCYSYDTPDGVIMYHWSDPELISSYSGGKKVLKSKAVMLSESKYPEGSYVDKSEAVELNGEMIWKEDLHEVYERTGETKWVHKGESISSVIIDILDSPEYGRSSDWRAYTKTGICLTSDKFPTYNGSRHLDNIDVKSFVENFKSRIWTSAAEKRKDSVKDKYLKDMNKAEMIHPDSSSLIGGKFYFKSSKKVNPSPRKFNVGGIGYSFGLELETSAGIIPIGECEKLGLSIVGDRTIPGPEYVTNVLHGDKGIESLKAIYDAASKNCIVDETCSTHIHIGGINSPYSDTPKFNRRFSALAIKLGAQIEEEIYQIQPKYRSPRLRHCSSIKDYLNFDINKDVNKTIAQYVFGYKGLDPDVNSKTKLGKWTEGRYKWLNLVNCNSDNSGRSSYDNSGGFKTIEFRIWGPTLDFNVAYNYVLISMAFVWFVENRQSKIIKGGVTLSDVIKSAYRRSPSIKDRLLNFISEYKALFGRKDPYSERTSLPSYRGEVNRSFEDYIVSEVELLKEANDKDEDGALDNEHELDSGQEFDWIEEFFVPLPGRSRRTRTAVNTESGNPIRWATENPF